MNTKSNIFIVGSFGVGKTTIGRQLANLLGMDFCDTDRMIEERLGVNLSWIFDVEGENGFQKREYHLLKELMEKSGAVISTGGGMILFPESCKLLKETVGKVVYLYTNVQQQVKRVLRNRYNRPSLRIENIEAYLKRLYEEYHILYKEIADVSFSTTKTPSKILTRQIIKHLNS